MKTSRLFCYGTLQVPAVMKAVTGRTFSVIPAELPDYAIYRVREADYPGIIHTVDDRTSGLLCSGLTARDLKTLDRFESDFYRRTKVTVVTEEDEVLRAWAYIVPSDHREYLTEEPWRLEDFIEHHLDRFMAGFVEGRRAVFSGEADS